MRGFGKLHGVRRGTGNLSKQHLIISTSKCKRGVASTRGCGSASKRGGLTKSESESQDMAKVLRYLAGEASIYRGRNVRHSEPNGKI